MGSTKFTWDWFDLRKCNLNDWMRMTEFWKIDLFRWAFWKRLIIWQFMMSDEKVIGFSSSQLRWLDGNSLIGDDFFPFFFFFFWLFLSCSCVSAHQLSFWRHHFQPLQSIWATTKSILSWFEAWFNQCSISITTRRYVKNKEHTPTHTHTKKNKKTRNVGRLSIAHIDRYHNDTARVNFH